MPSQDLLEKLFEVERKAETLVAEARVEAGRRVDEAKEKAQRSYSAAYDKAMKESTAERERAEAEIEAAYRAEIGDYRSRLESTHRDRAAFNAACEAFLREIL